MVLPSKGRYLFRKKTLSVEQGMENCFIVLFIEVSEMMYFVFIIDCIG